MNTTIKTYDKTKNTAFKKISLWIWLLSIHPSVRPTVCQYVWHGWELNYSCMCTSQLTNEEQKKTTVSKQDAGNNMTRAWVGDSNTVRLTSCCLTYRSTPAYTSVTKSIPLSSLYPQPRTVAQLNGLVELNVNLYVCVNVPRLWKATVKRGPKLRLHVCLL